MTTVKEQSELNRAQLLNDQHSTGNADLDMTGRGNSSDPSRQAASKLPLLTQKGERPDWQNSRAAATMAAPVQGSEAGDAFNRSLDLPDDKFASLGQGLKSAGEKAVTSFTQPSRDLSKSPLAMNKSDLGYDPRSHH